MPGETEHTQSEDEPHRVVHEVLKPVIQEVREIIQPYRRLVQQIQPVIEQTHTIVAKGEPRGAQEGQQQQQQQQSYSARMGQTVEVTPRKGEQVKSYRRAKRHHYY